MRPARRSTDVPGRLLGRALGRIVLPCVVAMVVALTPSISPAFAQAIPTAREGALHAVPLYGTVVHAWDAPDEDPFAPGHRGIDVAAPTGTPVRSTAEGVVSFAGSVAGNRTVSIDHEDGVKTTYSFLAVGSITVKKGDVVDGGHVIGSVGTGHVGSGLPSHVHLATRRSGVYFDPVEILVGSGYADLLSLIE